MSRYDPGPEFVEVHSLPTIYGADGSETWLLQLPHYWEFAESAAMQVQCSAGNSICGTCLDDEGTFFAVISDQATLSSQLYAAGSSSLGHATGDTACAAKVMQQRLILVRSDDLVLAATASLAKNNVEEKAEPFAAEVKRKEHKDLDKQIRRKKKKNKSGPD